jgi:DNA replication and repair protein RecF
MYLKFLELKNFRLFSEFAMQIPNKMILITGANAQGKTTLLEAIYYLATFSSFHATNDRQLICFGTEGESSATEVHGIFHTQKDHHLDVFIVSGRDKNNLPRLQKSVKYDGQKQKINQAIGKFNAVLFLPEMTQIIDGPPELRRKYIDLVIAQANPRYIDKLTHYNQALQQRNALLKSISEGAAKPAHLEVWDLKLAQLGAFLVKTRDVVL